ncbi:hypothetical protein [uncultured Alloprevotella sp.]|uniref:hypothetical protein n=1 Tax=uncultured Alloprevotella sp. TaxID=1283315 RepID=UPI002605C426|nr:hypothetical protein [uncultured Alloprevotella sp.]
MKTIRYTYQDWKTGEIYAKRVNWIVERPYEGNSFSGNFNIVWARQYGARFNVSLSDWARTAKYSLPQKYKAMYGSTILKDSSFFQSLTT